METGVSRRDKMKTLFGAVALATVVALLAPPIAQAAVQAVRVKGAVKVKDSFGGNIESEAIADMGLLEAPGSDGALAVRNFAGGGGFLGAGDCSEGTDNATGNFLENEVTVSGSIVTGIIITGDGTVTVTSAALNNIPLLNFAVNNNNPNVFVGLGNGLTATAPLSFTGNGTNCNFVILGQ